MNQVSALTASRLGRLGSWSFRHWRLTAGLWLLAMVCVTLIGRAAGSEFSNDTTGGHTAAIRAQSLLRAQFPSFAGDEAEVVFHTHIPMTAADVARIKQISADLRGLPHVVRATGPFDVGARDQVNENHTIAYAVVRYDRTAGQLPTSSIRSLVKAARLASSPALQVVAGGAPVTIVEKPAFGAAEGAGLLAAAVILFLAFGSLISMALPIVTALLGLITSFGVLDLVSHGLTVPTFSPELAALLGIGVGIDYALFIVTRYRHHLLDGEDAERAVAKALATSGRAVAFAGSTVVISLLGLLLVDLPYITGAAVGAIVAVLLVMTAAITLLPALLGAFGHRVASGRTWSRRRAGGLSAWWAWSRRVQRHAGSFTAAATAIVVLIGLPLFGLRLGFGDAGNAPRSDATRMVYDLISEGFGPGSNGPLLVVASTAQDGQAAAVDRLAGAIAKQPDVASVGPPLRSPSGRAAVVVVIPASAPQDKATVSLVHRLRDHTIPQVLAGTRTTALIGGETAASIDSSAHLSRRLPIVVGAVVLLSLLLLAGVFRSVAIPVKAAVMNLLSTGAAYGVIVAVFQWGWGASVLNAGAKGPIEPWIPVMLFTILFGLSMDYELFLMSRVREEWLRGGDPHEAVATGLASTARVITIAAAIMICVFGVFALKDLRALKIFGLGMATAVFIDATLLRVVLVPAVLHSLGRRAWWAPNWLDRLLPRISVEPGAEQSADFGLRSAARSRPHGK